MDHTRTIKISRVWLLGIPCTASRRTQEKVWASYWSWKRRIAIEWTIWSLLNHFLNFNNSSQRYNRDQLMLEITSLVWAKTLKTITMCLKVLHFFPNSKDWKVWLCRSNKKSFRDCKLPWTFLTHWQVQFITFLRMPQNLNKALILV